jgi:hypothetical protein
MTALSRLLSVIVAYSYRDRRDIAASQAARRQPRYDDHCGQEDQR